MGNRRIRGKFSGNCPKCGVYREFLAVDHIVPRWKFRAGIVFGDPECNSNIQYICDNCHADKTRIEMETENPSKRPESREKIKEGIKRTGWKPTEEWRAKQSLSHKGLKPSDETRAKHTENNLRAWATTRRTPEAVAKRKQQAADRAQRRLAERSGGPFNEPVKI